MFIIIALLINMFTEKFSYTTGRGMLLFFVAILLDAVLEIVLLIHALR